MESFGLESIVFAAVVGAVVLALYFALETWFLAWEQRIPSPLVQMLYRAGAEPQRLASPAAAREVTRAERNCPTCPACAACREWLESGSPSAYRAFCSNAALVERLTAGRGR